MARYDIKENSWGIYQHNPNTTSNIPIRNIKHAQSVVIEGLDKAFVISGRHEVSFANDSWAYYNGMLIYDFKEKTWEHRNTRWGAWMMGVVNHLALGEPSSGYIVGFAGGGREVCTVNSGTNRALITHPYSCTLGGANGSD